MSTDNTFMTNQSMLSLMLGLNICANNSFPLFCFMLLVLIVIHNFIVFGRAYIVDNVCSAYCGIGALKRVL